MEQTRIFIIKFQIVLKLTHDDNQNKKGSIRDYVSTLEIAILSNIEFQNAKLIEQGLNKKERLLLF